MNTRDVTLSLVVAVVFATGIIAIAWYVSEFTLEGYFAGVEPSNLNYSVSSLIKVDQALTNGSCIIDIPDKAYMIGRIYSIHAGGADSLCQHHYEVRGRWRGSLPRKNYPVKVVCHFDLVSFCTLTQGDYTYRSNNKSE